MTIGETVLGYSGLAWPGSHGRACNWWLVRNPGTPLAFPPPDTHTLSAQFQGKYVCPPPYGSVLKYCKDVAKLFEIVGDLALSEIALSLQ